MTIHEYGIENEKIIVLIHPAVVMWNFFERVIPLLEKDYHLIIPAIPGYDPDVKSDFTSIEEISKELESWFKSKGISEIYCIYGCSMGGAFVIKMLANGVIHFTKAVIDGGITPYQLPWILTRAILLRDFLMISLGKIGGVKLLEKAFKTDELSDEDLKYAANVLEMISYKTIWRTFDSTDNYSMPKAVSTDCSSIEYWYGELEEKARDWDIKYIKKVYPTTQFIKFEKLGHAGLAPFQPERFAKALVLEDGLFNEKKDENKIRKI